MKFSLPVLQVLSVWVGTRPVAIYAATCGGGNRGDGICPNINECCSQWGWCGTTPDHCSGNPPPSPTPPPPTPVGGTCGGGNVGNGVCADTSLCCSEFGWCGTTPIHCSGNPPPTPPATPEPTHTPMHNPTSKPTPLPIASPTPPPTMKPTGNPTLEPTPRPTPLPSASPSSMLSSISALSCPSTLDQMYKIDDAKTLYYAVVPSNPADANNGILCARLEAAAKAWLGFAISTDGMMIGSEAIMGNLDTPPVKCNLVSKGTQACVLMEEAKQTLMDTNFVQEDGMSKMSFTKLLVEEGEIPINVSGENIFLHAHGSSNDFGYHAGRGSFTLEFSPLSPTNQPTAKPMPTNAPSESPTNYPSESPTKEPTSSPTDAPTFYPTRLPSSAPTPKPVITNSPTPDPAASSAPKSFTPTSPPSKGHSIAPTITVYPTLEPTPRPTPLPSASPSAMNHPSTAKPIGELISSSPQPSADPTATTQPSVTVSPTSNGTATHFPSQSPTEFPFIFEGIEDAISFFSGVIDIDWDFPMYVDGEVVDLETVRYHVLASVGDYDFAAVLANTTAEDLIAEFDHNNNGNSTKQYHLVDGDILELSLNTTYEGELHTLLVIAEADGMFSRNVEATSVYTSTSDPVVKEDINITGVFFPTENLNITLDFNSTTLEFNGPGGVLRQEHLDLTVGEYVVGFTSEFDIFTLLIIDVIESSLERVVLATQLARVEDLFDSLDYESSSALSRPNKVEMSPASANRYRHLIARKHTRKLFIDKIGKAIVKTVEKGVEFVGKQVKKAFNAIGDALTDLAEGIVDAFEDLYNALTKGEVKKEFNLVDFDVSIDEVALDASASNGNEVEAGVGATLGKITGQINARSDLYVRMKVSTSNLLVEAGWVVNYGADLDIELLNEGTFSLTKNVTEGKKHRYKFVVVFVPVVVSVQPKVDLEFGLSMSLKNGDGDGAVKLQAGGKGSGRMVAGAELPPRLFSDFKQPDFDPYFKFDAIDSVEFGVSLAVAPKIEVQLYEGALKGSLGVSLGPKVSTTIGFTKDEDTCNILDSVDIDFEASASVNLGTVFSDSLALSKTLFSESYPLTSIDIGGNKCSNTGPCGDAFLDELAEGFSDVFNSQIFLSQAADPSVPPSPSTVYKFEDFVKALEKLKKAEKFQFWLGDKCGSTAKKQALVNIASFLGQAMLETIIYDACDENNWDLWFADVYKEPESPPEYVSAFYPMSSSCGQLGQSYEDYDCPDACPKDSGMEITGSTNANWIGAPPPLFCGPKSKYDGLGYWNPLKFCEGPDNKCEGQPFYYPGQTAGDHVPLDEDSDYPEWYYANPIPGRDGSLQPPRFESLPRTNVEGCCWWGRGVIQTTGRCNFGKLNKRLGAGAGSDALYGDINFCSNPQAVCEGPSELKWIAGIFFWTSEVETYSDSGTSYKKWVNDFIESGCVDDPDKLDSSECDTLFTFASGVVNRGCHDPGETGCPGCIPGATCDPAHNIPERIAASKQALRALLKLPSSSGGSGPSPTTPTTPTGPPPSPPSGPSPTTGACGGGNVGNGVCADTSLCCSEFGWCGSTPDHCSGNPPPSPTPPSTPVTGTCGGGNVGNGICADSSLCCSQFGWCGDSAEYCSNLFN